LSIWRRLLGRPREGAPTYDSRSPSSDPYVSPSPLSDPYESKSPPSDPYESRTEPAWEESASEIDESSGAGEGGESGDSGGRS
jgi:hypothetical protein